MQEKSDHIHISTISAKGFVLRPSKVGKKIRLPLSS
jgi:hypothetical protein